MFEKCGIRDVLYRAYRSKISILIVTAVFLILGIVLFAAQSGKAQKTEGGMWVASACYQVSIDPAVEIGESTLDQVKAKEESMAATYSAIISADFSRKQIYEKLLENYTKEEIIQNLNLKVSAEELTAFSLNTALTSKVIDRTSVVNFFVKAKEKEFAEFYLTECRAIFEELQTDVKGSRIEYIDGVLDHDLTDSGSGGSMGKMIIPMMAIFGLGISLLAVLINALFFPTVNRKSDFCAYDLPVISEVSMAGIREGRSDE